MISPMDTHEGLADIVTALRERAGFAREENTGTADADARYFEKAADEIERLRGAAQGARNPLDAAWEGVNALGGTGSTAEELAFIYGIERALSVIEELGGMDPLTRPSVTSTHKNAPASADGGPRSVKSDQHADLNASATSPVSRPERGTP